ncbi:MULTISPECIES: hypothetical protein [unclassified Oceanispirochaeta]|uniref:hypothetical protein n=1 Tax=unclassified Oceanispirochaeta TaxID=2635722 RepID=UPI000E0935C1|nr:MULTISPECIES: hypothetical protein [unclassified Oceanispirochaeta]MBF9018482.1 hypothetical protein [Oceanispirochaeta sp. M2]NPD74889.1 hypothetical protein [Oceanispirochaeta sp. M1]RDG29276.1 hypothetical protein DV872_22590 [Oceanispirochaeta sp. M1]
MNKYLQTFLAIIMILLVLSLIVWAIFFINDKESKIMVFGIVGAILTALTSVATVSLNHTKAKERELELIVLKEKQKVFEHFYNAYFEMLKTTKEQSNSQKQKLLKNSENEILMFKRGLMNWGSEKLISSYFMYDKSLIQNRDDSLKMLIEGNIFLKELRKEMGFSDSGKLNILKIVLDAQSRNDLDEKIEKGNV